jgi:hypothetical protein
MADEHSETPEDTETVEHAEDQTASADEPGEVPARVRPRRRVSKLLVAARVVMGLVSATALAAMSLVYLRVDQLDQSKNTTDAVAEAQVGPNAPVIVAEDDGANDILVVGNDSRTESQGRPLSA